MIESKTVCLLITKYWEAVKNEGMHSEGEKAWMMTKDPDGWRYLNYWGIYDAYLKLRNAIPYIVNLKKYAASGEGYEHYGNKRRISELNPDTDYEEATKVGKILIDAMVKYLKE